MKKLSLILLLLFTVVIAIAQSKKIDTLRAALSKATDDTTRIIILMRLGTSYYISKPDSSIIFGQQGYELAVKHNRIKGQAGALNNLANAYATLGDYVKSLQLYFKALKSYEQENNVPGMVNIYNNIGATYIQSADYAKGLSYMKTAKKQWDTYASTHRLKNYLEKEQNAILLINIAECFLYTNKIDSADHYLQLCYLDSKKHNYQNLINNAERDLGEVEIARNHKDTALKYLKHAVYLSILNQDIEMLSMSYLSTSKLYHKYLLQDSAKFYAEKALETAQSQKYLPDVLNAGKVLYTYYEEEHNLPEAYKYYKLATEAKDSLYSQDKVKQIMSLDFDEKQRQREIEAVQTRERDKIRMFILIAGMVILLVLAFIFWRANKARTKAYNLLHKQKDEIDRQKAKVEDMLGELKATQKQLIQSEKMASLGELTAGIAHEIQNPLNFVNNFAEVNAELTQELKEELRNGHTGEAIAIADNLEQNMGKIQHHGKRADFIVKGMLQHSRTSTGEKQPTKVNILAEEFLKLSYHGLRAKEKSFNAELITHFDPDLPKINVVPQDIGRVLLNLFNNAFYAVNQKSKTAGPDYKPEVSVTTSTENGLVAIKVKDNGIGIPDAIKDKIMQPFFTTKPTGEGTGLGLSLTYDMVVKGHGGKIEVNTKDGEFTEFTITLPLN